MANEPPIPEPVPPELRPDRLTEPQVEKLLAQLGTTERGGEQTQAATSGQAAAPPFGRHIFREYCPFSERVLRKLKVRHESFLRSLGARLSLHLRLEITLQGVSFEPLPFQKFTESISAPSHLTLLRFEPLEGVAILEVSPRLGLAWVDRQLGGSGNVPEAARELSSIEIRLLSQIEAMIAAEWCGAWQDLAQLSAVPLGTEENGQYLRSSNPEDIVLLLGMEARFGTAAQPLRLVLPYGTLQPLLLKLEKEDGSTQGNSTPPAKPVAGWNPALGELQMRVSAELPPFTLTAKAVATLKPGDLLPVSEQALKQVRVCCQGVPKLAGVLGTIDSRWAIEVRGLPIT